MNELKCPHCGEVFQVDESGYASIVQQVRDSEFEKELKRRESELTNKSANELMLQKMQDEQERAKIHHDNEVLMMEKDRLIEQLRSQISNNEMEKKLAVTMAMEEKNKELTNKTAEISELKNKVSNQEFELTLQEKTLKEKYEEQLKMKDEQIAYYKDFKAKQSTKMNIS